MSFSLKCFCEWKVSWYFIYVTLKMVKDFLLPKKWRKIDLYLRNLFWRLTFTKRKKYGNLVFSKSFYITTGYYIIVHYIFSIYVPLRMLFRCVRCFDSACFNITIVKNYTFHDAFSTCWWSSQFFFFFLFGKLLPENFIGNLVFVLSFSKINMRDSIFLI